MADSNLGGEFRAAFLEWNAAINERFQLLEERFSRLEKRVAEMEQHGAGLNHKPTPPSTSGAVSWGGVP